MGARRTRLAAAVGARRCLDEPWAATLALHLGHRDTGDEAEFRRGRRYAVARRLAGLFASYAAQRPQLLVDWSAGDATDGLGRPARRRPGLAAPAVACPRGDGGRAPVRASGTPRRWSGCARVPATCRHASRCSGTPGCRPPRSSCSATWPPITTCTCGCLTPARPLAAARRPRRPDAPHATTSATVGSGTRCSRRSAATSASCSAASARPPTTTRSCRRPRRLTRCSAGSRPTCATTPSATGGPHLRPGRPVGAGAPLPRPRPPGAGPPRGAARAARGRARDHLPRAPARAARHPGDVS